MDLLDIAIAKQLAGGGGGSGTDNYNDLSNLPKINDTTLSGNKSSSALRLQSEITSDSKLASDLVDDTNQDNKFVTSIEKNTWNGKQNAIDSDHKLSSDLVDDANKTNKFVTSTEKNTWNNKQNAIDSDHKLSSSLVSFTTAEAAALASGIDSSKVGQISTNQTNILYAIDNGGKNKFNCDPIVLQPMNTVGTWSGNTYTVSSKTFTINNGEVTLSGGLDQYNTARMVIFKGDIPAGTKITGCPAGGATAGIDSYCIGVYDSNDYFVTADIGNGVSIPNDLTNVTVCVTRARGAMSSSLVFKPMLCTVDAWNISHEFVPCSLPNYDLTRLQSEDRASLAEVVDSGAKNVAPVASLTKSSSGSTDKIGISLSVGTTYVITFDYTATDSSEIVLRKANDTDISISPVFNGTGKYYKEYTVTDNIKSYYMYTNGSATISNLMICTKAAFGVSSKFVPYKVDTTKPWALLKSGDDLNDIVSAMEAKNVYVMFATGDTGVSNKPANGIFMVRTTNLGGGAAVQEVTMLTGNDRDKSYVRTFIDNNNWSTWKQTTNV